MGLNKVRWIRQALIAFSLLLGVAVCILWARSRSGEDEVAWSYDRYLSDGSAASNQVYLTSEDRLWLSVLWGHVGPFDGRLSWGYYVRADQSGGRPRLSFRRRLDDQQEQNWPAVEVRRSVAEFSPVWWESSSRTKATDGDDSRYIRIGISHWLAALLLFLPPVLWLRRLRLSGGGRAIGVPTAEFDSRAHFSNAGPL